MLEENKLLQLDPVVEGVFKGPYPLGIDPVITRFFMHVIFVSILLLACLLSRRLCNDDWLGV